MELGLRSSLGSMLAVIGLQWLLAGPAIGGPSIPTNVGLFWREGRGGRSQQFRTPGQGDQRSSQNQGQCTP